MIRFKITIAVIVLILVQNCHLKSVLENDNNVIQNEEFETTTIYIETETIFENSENEEGFTEIPKIESRESSEEDLMETIYKFQDDEGKFQT